MYQEETYYLAIDIGGTAVKMGILTKQGIIKESISASVNFDHYKTPILDTVMEVMNTFLDHSPYKIAGIAVSATGQIDTQKGEVIGTAGHIDNWLNSKIKERMEKETGLFTTVCNDANCMILGEKWLGGARGHRNVVGITIGTGVGGGIIVDDKILLGDLGLAGEVGHMTINRMGKPCTCNGSGCYEHYASTTALVEKVKVLYPNLLEEQANGRWIFEQVANNNHLVQEIVDQWIDDIAAGLVNLVHIFNPSCILIGGGVSSQEEYLIKPLKEKIFKRAMPRFTDHLVIQKAELENTAGMIGALRFHLDQLD